MPTREAGAARWIATYSFGDTGRKVVNRVRSDFRFDGNGLIAEQHDDFPFWTWSRQALGLPGLALGWTPLLRSKVRSNAAAELARFRADREPLRPRSRRPRPAARWGRRPPRRGPRGRGTPRARAGRSFAALDDRQEVVHQRDLLDLLLEEPLEELLALEVVLRAGERRQLVELLGHLALLLERDPHRLDDVGEAALRRRDAGDRHLRLGVEEVLGRSSSRGFAPRAPGGRRTTPSAASSGRRSRSRRTDRPDGPRTRSKSARSGLRRRTFRASRISCNRRSRDPSETREFGFPNPKTARHVPRFRVTRGRARAWRG